MHHIFRVGYGVMLMELTGKAQRQETLFDNALIREKAAKAMAVMDAINRVLGLGMMHSSAVGILQRWAMHSENRSPRYTTQWNELPVAHEYTVKSLLKRHAGI